jgi:putative zinc finger protein
MGCTDLRGEMMDVLYGEATAATARKLEEHVAVCAACREEMGALRRLRKDLSAWRLPESVRPTAPRVASPSGWLLASAAAVLLCVGGGLGLALAEARFRQVLDQRETRYREDIAQTIRAAAAPPQQRDDETVLVKVREMIRQSEARQAVRLNASLADFSERTDAQRRYDLARVSAGLSYLDGKTGQNVARTTELMGYVLQASQKK